MTLYVIKQTDNNPDLNNRSDYLRAACNNRDVKFVELIATKTDVTDLPKLGKGAMLYNLGRGFEAQTLESLLLNDDVVTFYKTTPNLNNHISTNHWNIVLEKNFIALPYTIYNPSNDRELLGKYVELLGGFPIIVKASGNSAGIGVMKIDSYGGLYSVTDYLKSINQHFVFKKFIQSRSSMRTVVLGNEVIASAEFICDDNEFRSNTSVGNKVQRAVNVDQSTKDTAIKAVHLLNFDFGAVDLVIDSNNNHYVLEVNFPFGFIPLNPIENEGWDSIADKMIEFLVKKGNVTR